VIADFVSERFSSDGPPGAARRTLALALAIVFHVAILWALAVSVSFRIEEPEEIKSEPKIIAMAPREPPPPPPDIVQIGPVDIETQRPRFRPRVPTVSRQIQEGDPALAVWTYLCNRDRLLSPTVKVACPDPPKGDVSLGLLDPVNRRGDVGIMFGRSTKTMTLDEAGVARGWTKPKPEQGQGMLLEKTDNSGVPDPVLDRNLPTKGKAEGAARR
jgi:hypothetical protein